MLSFSEPHESPLTYSTYHRLNIHSESFSYCHGVSIHTHAQVAVYRHPDMSIHLYLPLPTLSIFFKPEVSAEKTLTIEGETSGETPKNIR